MASSTTVSSSNKGAAASKSTKAQNFAHNSQDSNGISLVVPRVFPNWNHRKVKRVFISCGWGFVDRVDIVPIGRIPKGRFKTAFIHFRPNSWNNNRAVARSVITRLREGPSSHVEVTYDDPWFWKVFISSAKKPDEAPKPPPRPVVRFSESKCASKTGANAARVVNRRNLKVDVVQTKSAVAQKPLLEGDFPALGAPPTTQAYSPESPKYCPNSPPNQTGGETDPDLRVAAYEKRMAAVAQLAEDDELNYER